MRVHRSIAFGVMSLAAAMPAVAADPVAIPSGGLATRYASYPWAARRPAGDAVDFRGVVNFDQAGGSTAQMMYPMPGLLGALAAVATHAAITGSVRDREKSRIQTEADKVLSPYRGHLDRLDQRSLFQQAMAKTSALAWSSVLEPQDAFSASGWVVESHPLFLMTQDQRALILENTVAIFAPGNAADPAYRNVVRVVSMPLPDSSVEALWNAEQGSRLREVSAELLAASLTIARQAVDGSLPAAAAASKTFKFPEGGRERMDRAQLIQRTCDRIMLQNLRGWLLSVPTQPDGKGIGEECSISLKSAVVTTGSPTADRPAEVVVAR